MAIVQFARFKTDKPEEMIKTAKQAKAIFEKHGAEFLRLSRFHTGEWAGQWLVTTRYSSWEAFGKAQDGLAKDPAWAKLIANTAGIARLMGRATSTSALSADNIIIANPRRFTPGGFSWVTRPAVSLCAALFDPVHARHRSYRVVSVNVPPFASRHVVQAR